MNTEQRERARRQGGELIQAAMAALDAAEQKLAAAERNTTYALGCQAESLAAFNAAEARCRELGQWGNALHEQWTKAESDLAQLRERVTAVLERYRASWVAPLPWVAKELAHAVEEALRGTK